MERTLKQSVLSIVFEYVLKLIFFSVLLAVLIQLAFESEILGAYLDGILQGQDRVILGCVLLLFVYFSHQVYRKIDLEVLANGEKLIEKIKYDNYDDNLEIAELNYIQESLKRKEREKREKDQFLSTAIAYISHDMKTPITIIEANVDLLRKSKELSELSNKERLVRIGEQSEKISEYLSSLIDITSSMTDSQANENISLSKYLNHLEKNVRLYSDSIEEKINIRKNVINTGDDFITGNLLTLDKCLQHLLNNAMEHKKNTISINIEKTKKHIVITVVDDGEGFHSEALSKARDIFYTDNFGRTSGKGYGIGLYFVDSYMQSVDGELIFGNIEPKGAFQSMKIPYYEV